jgi:hypothetical protein
MVFAGGWGTVSGKPYKEGEKRALLPPLNQD